MGIFSRFEGRMEDGLEGVASRMFDAPISPVQISKKAEKAMRREKMVGAGKQYAPTLYTVLVNPDDDQRLFGYYPTLAGETETYLSARAASEGFLMDGQPLVRFIVDESLRRGKFEVVAELVSAPIIAQLRKEEMERYGLIGTPAGQQDVQYDYAPRRREPVAPATQVASQAQGGIGTLDERQGAYAPVQQAASGQAANHPKQPLPYVPEDEIDRSIDYGEYTFNSKDFEDYEQSDQGQDAQGAAAADAHDANAAVLEDDQGVQQESDLSGFDVAAYDPYNNSEPLPERGALDRQGAHAASDNRAPHDIFDNPAHGAVSPSGGVAPAAQVRARLLNTAGGSIDLVSGRYIIGRSSNSDIVVDDINASRSHAEVRYEPQGVWSITDLGSTNGTQVNGSDITTHTLADGDRISIGMTDFAFRAV